MSGILLRPTWWEDIGDASPPSQWMAQSQAVTVQFSTTEAAIFTGTLAIPANTPVTLTAATMPGGFSASTTYYAIPLLGIGPLVFALSTTPGGTPVKASSAGATVVAHDQRYYFLGAAQGTQLLLHANGTNVDSSAYHNTMTLNGAASISALQPKFGSGSMKFGPRTVQGSVSTPITFGGPLDCLAGDFTIEFWAYIHQSPVQLGVMLDYGGKNTNVRGGIQVTYGSTSGKISVLIQNGGGNFTGWSQITGGTTVVVDTWYHIAVVRQGTQGTLYINGVADGTGLNTWSGTVSYPSGGPINIGGSAIGDGTGAGAYMDGYIDEFRVSNTAVYTGNFTPPSGPFNDPDAGAVGDVIYIGNTVAGLLNGLFGTVRIGYQVITPTSAPPLNFEYDIGAGVVNVPLTNTAGATGTISICLDNATKLRWGMAVGSFGATVAFNEAIGDTTYGNVNFNCSCLTASTFETLAQLRRRMMVRLGFATTADNPPPGMADLLNDFLISAQRNLWRRYPATFTRRIFQWNMQAGDRFYGVKDNDDDTYRNLRMDFTKGVEWSGIYDGKNTWTPIFPGIDPELYTMVQQFGRPVRYELRDCIEVFPAPDGPYVLVMKGHIELQAFAADSDQTTIDSEVVFLHALAVAKAHYGQVDAQAIQAMANSYLGELCAATHLNKRYIPGAGPQMPIVKPALIQFQGP